MVDEDENISYVSLTTHLDDDAERKKNSLAKEFAAMGDVFVHEIEKKKKLKNMKKGKFIPYILKHSGGFYTEDDLLAYSYADVEDIFNTIKRENKSFFTKLLHFIFNIQ